MVAGHPAPLQLLLPYPVAGNQQLSSRLPLRLERQLHHGSTTMVQYQEHKYAYGLEGLDSPLQELVQPLVCSGCHIGPDNETSLLFHQLTS